MNESRDSAVRGSPGGVARRSCAAWALERDEQCAGRVLAAAVGASLESIGFEFCRNVLQKHWGIACPYGDSSPPQSAPIERWRDMGKIDPVKAVLLNESIEQRSKS